MKEKLDKQQILSYTLAIAVCIIGSMIGITISHYQHVGNGILGVAVIYYWYRFYFWPLKIISEPPNKPFVFKFPDNIWNFATGFIMAIVLPLAGQQIINTVCWFINLIRN
jgi:hypothetical protein